MTVSYRLALAFALPLALAASSGAQTGSTAATAPAATTAPTATTAAPAPAAPAPAEEVVKLSEFEVTTNNNGYTASETMSGSRVNTKIVDLPYSIVDLTQDFFKDFSVQILDENMTYIGGLTGINIGGGFNLRGFAATSQLRDGYYRLGRYGLSNIGTLEIIRGPNAAIYGRSSPGGMINFISVQPSEEDAQTLTVSDGSYKQNLYQFVSTGALDHAGKTYYILDLDQTSRDYPGQYSEIRNAEDFAAIKHDFSDTSHLVVRAEYFLQIQHAPQQAAQTLFQARTATPDNAATSTAVGLLTGLTWFNPYGPNSELNRGSATFSADYDKAFNDVWSYRVGAYNFRARRWDYNQNTGWGSITVPLNATPGQGIVDNRGSVPSRGEIMEDGGGFQQDLLAHYFTFNHSVENNTLLTVDFNDYYRWDPTWEYATNANPDLVAWSAARTVTLVPEMFKGSMQYVPNAPVSYFPKFYTPNNLTLLPTAGAYTGTLTERRTSSLGGNIRQQMLLLDGRLIVYAGLRNDTVRFSERDYTVAFPSVGFGDSLAPGTGGANQPGGSVVRRYEHQNKPNMGFNYAVTKDGNLRVYGSYSTAYFVDQTSRPSVIASATYAPFTARGFDYGVKGSYFNQQLNFTFGGYYDREYNVLVSDTVELPNGSFTDLPEQDGDQLVRGWETDVSWTFPNGVALGESFGGVHAIYTNYGSAYPEVIGRPVAGITPTNGSVYAKYTINSGAFKGLQINPLITYVAATPINAPNSGDTTTIENGVSVVTAHTNQWMLKYPSFTVCNLDFTYDLGHILGPKWDPTVTLGLNNLFNRYYLKTSGNLGDGRNFLVTFSLTHGVSH